MTRTLTIIALAIALVAGAATSVHAQPRTSENIGAGDTVDRAQDRDAPPETSAPHSIAGMSGENPVSACLRSHMLVHNCHIPGRPFTGPDANDVIKQRLARPHAQNQPEWLTGKRIEAIKHHYDVPADENLVFGRTGDVYRSNGDYLGSLTDKQWGRG